VTPDVSWARKVPLTCGNSRRPEPASQPGLQADSSAASCVFALETAVPQVRGPFGVPG